MSPFGHYLVYVGQRLLVLDEHLGELQALVRIYTHHVSQEENPVRGVGHLQTSNWIKMQLTSQSFSSLNPNEESTIKAEQALFCNKLHSSIVNLVFKKNVLTFLA